MHATQIGKGAGVPYIAYLLDTASIALECGASEDEAIAALLHSGELLGGCNDSDTTPKPPLGQRKKLSENKK